MDIRLGEHPETRHRGQSCVSRGSGHSYGVAMYAEGGMGRSIKPCILHTIIAMGSPRYSGHDTATLAKQQGAKVLLS